MLLECPKCHKSFTIPDLINTVKQTCSTCNTVIDITKTRIDAERHLSLYEVQSVENSSIDTDKLYTASDD